MEPPTALPPLASRGFTLVEMIVVLAIIVIITAVVVNGQSGYNRSIVLTDTAYTVAYSVRQAQSLGLASRGISSISNAGYGVRFAGTTGYVVFADTGGSLDLSQAVCPVGIAGTTPAPELKRGNCRYDSAPTDTIVQNYTFSRGFTIQSICGKLSNGGSCVALGALDVVFLRPETRAILTTPGSGTPYTCAEVRVAAPSGGVTRIVRISQLGEISVGPSCP